MQRGNLKLVASAPEPEQRPPATPRGVAIVRGVAAAVCVSLALWGVLAVILKVMGVW